MLKNMDPPLGFGSKCPDRLAFKKLIRMNQPIDEEGMVHFTTTLFALIRENLSIKMRSAEEMDHADLELRSTIIKVWPYEGKDKIDLLIPPREGKYTIQYFSIINLSMKLNQYCLIIILLIEFLSILRNWERQIDSWKDIWWTADFGELEGYQVRKGRPWRSSGKLSFVENMSFSFKF